LKNESISGEKNWYTAKGDLKIVKKGPKNSSKRWYLRKFDSYNEKQQESKTDGERLPDEREIQRELLPDERERERESVYVLLVLIML